MRIRVLGLSLSLLIGLVVSCGDDDDVPAPPVCSPYLPTFGCFKGQICNSAAVSAGCVNGQWACPAGTHPGENCPPDPPASDAGPQDVRTQDTPSLDVPAGDGDAPRMCSPPYPDIGCFKGETCRSEHVPAVCVNGGWTCPAGTHATEFCPPELPASDAGPPDAP